MSNGEFSINFFEEKAKSMTASNNSIMSAIDYLQKEIEMVELQINISESLKKLMKNFEFTAAKNENTEDFTKNEIEFNVNTPKKKDSMSSFNNHVNFDFVVSTVTPLNQSYDPAKSKNDNVISSAA